MLLEINNIKIKKSLKNLFFSDFFIFISISKLKEIKNNLLKFICKLIMKVGKFMEKITYFLCESNASSTEFYKKNLNFSKKVLNKLEDNFSNDINDYMNYINKNNMEQLRSKSEYLLEILMIGVFWKEHVNKAISLSKIPRNILIKLSTLREKESIKKIVDINRGLLEYLFLNRRSNDKVKISLENYKKLVNYLKACGDYKEEAKRLEVWISYFFSLNKNKVDKILTSYLEFAKYFENIVVPKCTYAVFETEKCKYPTEVFLDLRKKIAGEWLPGSGFSLAEAPELVVSYWFQGDKREQRYRELWIPVTKNE